MLILLLSLLAYSGILSLLRLRQIQRAHQQATLQAEWHGVANELAGGVGISVLCSGVEEPRQLENLLAVAYPRYEVILVADSRVTPDWVADLMARYRLIRVAWNSSDELPVRGIRALYRSRKRAYRRLILVDKKEGTPAEDWDAAALAASYDFLLPLHHNNYLLPKSIERLVCAIGEHPIGAVACFRARVGVPVRLLLREALVEAGGFTRLLRRCPPKKRQQQLWLPLVVDPTRLLPARRWWVAVGALLSLGAGLCMASGVWVVALLLLTLLLILLVVCYAQQLLSSLVGADNHRLFIFSAIFGGRTEK